VPARGWTRLPEAARRRRDRRWDGSRRGDVPAWPGRTARSCASPCARAGRGS